MYDPNVMHVKGVLQCFKKNIPDGARVASIPRQIQTYFARLATVFL
jgi:hypothetical protein